MTTREAYLERLKAQLDEWDKDIEGLEPRNLEGGCKDENQVRGADQRASSKRGRGTTNAYKDP